jgi:hypothetical protein
VIDMTHANPSGAGAPMRGIPEEQALREEIAYCEARLRQMGHLGDCAYEKAMTRFYEALVEEKRQALDDLRAARPALALA